MNRRLIGVVIFCTESEEQDRDNEFAGSFTRMIFIMVVTYCTLYGYMTLINVDKAYLNAIVPTMGYNMSTWSLPYVKCLWMTFKEKTETNLAVHMAHDTRGALTANTVDVEMDAL